MGSAQIQRYYRNWSNWQQEVDSVFKDRLCHCIEYGGGRTPQRRDTCAFQGGPKRGLSTYVQGSAQKNSLLIRIPRLLHRPALVLQARSPGLPFPRIRQAVADKTRRQPRFTATAV